MAAKSKGVSTPRRQKGRSAVSAAGKSLGYRGVIFALAGAAAAGAAALAGLLLVRRPVDEGTEPTDLIREDHPDGSERAIDAFRPDPTAAVPPSEHEALCPALVGTAGATSVD